MTDTIDVTTATNASGGPGSGLSLEDLAAELTARAGSAGVSLVGPGGLLSGLTKSVPEAALEAELTEHVGYQAYDPAGHHSGNSHAAFDLTLPGLIREHSHQDVEVAHLDH